MIYGQILNNSTPVDLQSLKDIFLVGAVNSKDITGIDYPMSIIFHQVHQINHHSSQPFTVSVEYFCGDTLASQGLGGFIESTGNANFPCRECEIQKKQIGNFSQKFDTRFDYNLHSVRLLLPDLSSQHLNDPGAIKNYLTICLRLHLSVYHHVYTPLESRIRPRYLFFPKSFQIGPGSSKLHFFLFFTKLSKLT